MQPKISLNFDPIAFGGKVTDGKEAKKQSFISRQKIYSLELRFSS
jgi:hypothetical protein